MTTMLERVKAKYPCPMCNRLYETADEATNCYKSPRGRFQPGDIVWDGSSRGYVYRVEHVDPVGCHTADGASVKFVQELRKAARMIHQPNDGYWMVGSFWCKAQLYPVAEAQSLAKELASRLKYAEKFLAEVKACQRS